MKAQASVETKEDRIKERDKRLEAEDAKFKARASKRRQEIDSVRREGKDLAWCEEKEKELARDESVHLHNQRHLIRYVGQTAASGNERHLSDLLLVMAKNIDASLVEAGAVPEVDYTHLDVYRLALPFVLEIFRDDKSITFDVSNF